MNLKDHLEYLGIQNFPDNSYWDWGGEKIVNAIGISGLKKLEKLRKSIINNNASQSQRLSFYNYISNYKVSSIVHSMKADAIRASGEMVLKYMPTGSLKILDIGCNTGHLTTWYALNRTDSSITGIDISEIAIDTARIITKKLNIKNVEYINGDPSVELKLKKFDVIVDTQSVFEANNRKKMIELVSELTMLKGVFISIPQATNLHEFIKFTDEICSAGLNIYKTKPVVFSDLGEVGGYLMLIAGHEKPESNINIESDYNDLIENISNFKRQK